MADAFDPRSSDEALELSERLARLANSGFPLAAGLQAAASECDNPRLVAGLRMVAQRIERGEPLEEIIRNSPDWFPRHLSGLVIAALHTGTLGTALTELLEHQRAASSLRYAILRSLGYPLAVFSLALALFLLILFFVSEPFGHMFEEFQLELPIITRILLRSREIGFWVVLGVGGLIAVAALAARRFVRPATWSRFVSYVPIFGPLVYWSGVAQWCGLVGMLVKHHITLPEALKLSAEGVGNPYVGQLALSLAEGAEQGHELSDLIKQHRSLPKSLVPLIRWGEKMDSLHEAFATGRELFDRRVRMRAMLLQSILPPILFVMIAIGILFVVVALFAPLLNLLHGLS